MLYRDRGFPGGHTGRDPEEEFVGVYKAVSRTGRHTGSITETDSPTTSSVPGILKVVSTVYFGRSWKEGLQGDVGVRSQWEAADWAHERWVVATKRGR